MYYYQNNSFTLWIKNLLKMYFQIFWDMLILWLNNNVDYLNDFMFSFCSRMFSFFNNKIHSIMYIFWSQILEWILSLYPCIIKNHLGFSNTVLKLYKSLNKKLLWRYHYLLNRGFHTGISLGHLPSLSSCTRFLL